MITALLIVGVWLVLACPFAVFAGHCIALGQGPELGRR